LSSGTGSVVPVGFRQFALPPGVGERRGVVEFLLHLLADRAGLVDLPLEGGGRLAILIAGLFGLLAFRLGFVPRRVGLPVGTLRVARVLAFVLTVVSAGDCGACRE